MNVQGNTAEIIDKSNSIPGISQNSRADQSNIPAQKTANKIIDQFHQAILDPKGLSLNEWLDIQQSLKEIERLAPHIELIIRLRKDKEK